MPSDEHHVVDVPDIGARYRWIDDWVTIPNTPSGRENGRTNGIVVTADGHVVVFHQASPAVVTYDVTGAFHSAWGDHLAGAHGITLVTEGDREYLWLTDQYSGEVGKYTLDGTVVHRLERPDLPVYADKPFSPTWVAVNDASAGGNGDIWVADGYGTNLIHRYDASGTYQGSISGEEGTAGAFATPHAVWFEPIEGTPHLFIADNANRQIQVYTQEGAFSGSFGNAYLTSPRHGVRWGAYRFVPELFGRIVVTDAAGEFVTSFGERVGARDEPGWPNQPLDGEARTTFNSSHAMAMDRDGSIYVVEWRLGGRIIKLESIAR